MAKKEKEFESMEEESSALADKRANDLKGLGRKDRIEIGKIKNNFKVDIEKVKAKWASKKSKDAEEAAIAAKKKQIEDQKDADKEAKKKQK